MLVVPFRCHVELGSLHAFSASPREPYPCDGSLHSSARMPQLIPLRRSFPKPSVSHVVRR